LPVYPDATPKTFEISAASRDVLQLLRRVSEDGAGATCVTVNVDECGSLDAIAALPTNCEGAMTFLDVDRFGVPIAG
jgi:hypothetical protein